MAGCSTWADPRRWWAALERTLKPKPNPKPEANPHADPNAEPEPDPEPDATPDPDQVNRGGETIPTAEIERVLCAHPGVAEAMVFAAPHVELGEVVALALPLTPLRVGPTIDVHELREWAAGALTDPNPDPDPNPSPHPDSNNPNLHPNSSP